MHSFLTLAALFAAQVGDSTPPILRALRLPVLVTEARRAGVNDAPVRGLLEALRRRGLPAADAEVVVHEELAAVRAGAPKDNFGAFVHRQLEAGLRGRALAEAIRAEHEHRARGMARSGDRQPPARDTAKPGRRRP